MAYNNEWLRAFFGGHEYPYTDSQRYNDDWILAIIMKLVEEFNNFANLNKIKYADPISWDITRQYEGNTVVVDARTGNAYISSKPVPRGVQINNTYYWTEIYNYARVVDELRSQIATNEGDVTTASKPFEVGALVFVEGLLYRVIAPMIAGDSFVLNSNVVKTTVEAELKRVIQIIIEELIPRFEQLEADIDAEAQAREDADTSLSHDIEAEAQARADADDALTSDINDLATDISNISIYELPVMHGAVGDGVADDTAAIQATIDAAVANHKTVCLNGSYKVAGIAINGGVKIIGAHTQPVPSKATLVTSAPIQLNFTQNPITISDVEIQNTNSASAAIVVRAQNATIDRCRIASANTGIINSGSLNKFTNNQIVANSGWAFIFEIADDRLCINNIVTQNIISGAANLMLVRSTNNAVRPEGLLFANNDTMTTGNYGIMISAAYHVSIVNNTLDQIGRHVLAFNPTQDVNSIIFSDNYVGIVDGSFYAIGGYLSNTSNVYNLIVTNNNFYGASCIAYLNEYYQSAIIDGNNFESAATGYAGINCRRVAYLRVTNNRVFKTGNNATAFSIDGQNISHLVITGNMFIGLKTLSNFDVNHLADSDNLKIG